VHVPAQAALHAGALAHHVLAVIHQQPEPAGLAVELGHGESGLSKRGPRHGKGVDRVGLPQRAAGLPGSRHQPGRDPYDPFPRSDQIGLEPTGEMTTILQREHPLGPRSDPAEHRTVPLQCGRERSAGELATYLVHHRQRVRALVRVHPDHHHAGSFLPGGSDVSQTEPEDMPQSRSLQAPMKSRRLVLGCPTGGASLTSHGHRPGSEEVSQPAGQGDHHTEVKKSVARIPRAWVRRNSAQVGPPHRDAGPSPCRRRSVRIAEAETLMPSLASSPLIRTHPTGSSLSPSEG
jgi:hypothetical protein